MTNISYERLIFLFYIDEETSLEMLKDNWLESGRSKPMDWGHLKVSVSKADIFISS